VDVPLAKRWIRLLIQRKEVSKEGGQIVELNLLHILKFNAEKDKSRSRCLMRRHDSSYASMLLLLSELLSDCGFGQGYVGRVRGMVELSNRDRYSLLVSVLYGFSFFFG
jgi:hypothetical protein